MKAVVVEDSRLAREGLLKMLAKFPLIEVVGAAENATQASQLIDEYLPDVIFLDIHLPGENAFELLQALDYEPKIIFTTAYAEYAVRSFEFKTIDYLLKPISSERLAQAVEKLAQSANSQAHSEVTVSTLDYANKILVRENDNSYLLQLSDIYYFESCKNYVRIFSAQGKPFVKKSLCQIEERLPAGHFVRISRQYIVNLDHMVAVEDSINDGFDITMTDGTVLNASRRSAASLKSLLSI